MALTPPHPLPRENARFLQIRGQQCTQQCESEHRHTVGGRKFLYQCPGSGVQPRRTGSSTAGSGILESACVCEPVCLLRSSPRRGPASRARSKFPPNSQLKTGSLVPIGLGVHSNLQTALRAGRCLLVESMNRHVC